MGYHPLAMSAQKQNKKSAMDELTSLQRAWVLALVEHGNAYDAARAAGYGANSDTPERRDVACRVAAYENQRNPKIQAAIVEEAGHQLAVSGMIGVSTIIAIATDPTHKDRYKAAIRLAEHAGFQIVAKQEMVVKDERKDTKQMIAGIIEMARKLNLDPRTLLGSAGVVVDAEFKVVEDKPAIGWVEPSTDGLEDLL